MNRKAIKKYLATKLKEVRETKQLSLEQVCEQIKIGKKYKNYEDKNGTVPSLLTLIVIAEYYNVSIDYLLGMRSINKK